MALGVAAWRFGDILSAWRFGRIGGVQVYGQSAQSKKNVQLQVTHFTPTGVDDLSAYTVSMALLSGADDPVSDDWKAGTWISTPVGDWLAQCLVGPGGAVTPSPGTYYLWVKVTTPDETVVESVGQMEVTQ